MRGLAMLDVESREAGRLMEMDPFFGSIHPLVTLIYPR
jgi:hypothetical protein